MGRKAAGIPVLLCLAWLSGCGDGGDHFSGEMRVTEDAVRGTIITTYIQQSDSPASVWKGWAASRLYEDTGLILEICSAEGKRTEELKLRLTSGTVPDIIGFADREQAQLYIDAGMLLPLKEYEELLPALLEEEAYRVALERSAAGSGGELFLAPLSVGAAGENEYRSMPMLLKSAWERAGSPAVSDLEDYLNVIGRLRKAKPVSDMGESMYGICLWQEDGGVSGHAASLAYMYGIDMQTVSPLMEVDMVNGSIRSILREDSFYKRAVHFYYEANRRGLLDPDSPNQTSGNVERKMNSGRVLFAVDSSPAGGDSFLWKMEGGAAYTPMPAEDMRLYLEPDHIAGTGQYLAVNKNSQRAKEAVKLLDWLYREETLMYLYNGPEGVIWEYGENGLPRVTEAGRRFLKHDEEEFPELQGSLSEGIGPFGVLGRTPADLTSEGYAFSSCYWTDGENRDGDEEGGTEWNTVRASTAVYLTDMLPPGLSRTADEIEKLVHKEFWNMVYAQDEEEFQSVWQSLVKEADRMGMKDVAAFYEEAWGRAQEAATE